MNKRNPRAKIIEVKGIYVSTRNPQLLIVSEYCKNYKFAATLQNPDALMQSDVFPMTTV